LDAEERRRRRVHRALGNPVFFGEYYMRPYDPAWKDGGPLPRFGHDLLRFVHTAERGVVMLGVEHLKTTLGTQLYGLWRTVRAGYLREQLRGMLMSEEQGMAANNLGVIAWHVEHNDEIAADFCDDVGRPLVRPSEKEDTWREDAIVIDRDFPSKDPTWQAKGIDGKGIHGRRLDLFIGDDMVTPRNAHSPTLRRQALHTFDASIRNRLVSDGRAIVMGNFNDPRDLLSTLRRRARWSTLALPSMHKPGDMTVPAEEQDLADPNKSVPLWPTNWPRERHLTEYRETPNTYRRIHLLDERAERGEKLQISWLQQIEPEQTPMGEARVHMALDAAGGGDSHDLDFWNVTIGAEHGANLDIVGSIDWRDSLPKSIERLGALVDRFRRVGTGVFAIYVSKTMLENVISEAVGMKRPDLVPLLVRVALMGSKEERLEALGPRAQSGYLRIWIEAANRLTSDPEDQDEELSFIEQWRDMPGGRHDDKLDGADVLCRGVQEFAGVRDVEVELVVQ
jgi:hypothetical protein